MSRTSTASCLYRRSRASIERGKSSSIRKRMALSCRNWYGTKFLGLDQFVGIGESSPDVLYGHLVFTRELFNCHAASKSTDEARDGNPCSTDHRFAMLYPWVYDDSLIHLSTPLSAFICVLPHLAAQTHEVGVVAGDPHEQVVIGVRVILGSAQDVRAGDVDLQRRAAHLVVGTQQSGQLAAMQMVAPLNTEALKALIFWRNPPCSLCSVVRIGRPIGLWAQYIPTQPRNQVAARPCNFPLDMLVCRRSTYGQITTWSDE